MSTLDKLQEFLMESDEKDSNVVLMFDAMFIRKHLQYNVFTDSVAGVEWIDGDKRSAEYAQCLLVFMIRSIVKGWSQIIGFHFTQSTFQKDKLKCLLDSYLCALHSAGLRCRGMICDQEPSHVSLFRQAGVSPETPYYLCPSSGRRIYIIYDPPHLLKSTRNNLMTSDFLVSFLFFFIIIVTLLSFFMYSTPMEVSARGKMWRVFTTWKRRRP